MSYVRTRAGDEANVLSALLDNDLREFINSGGANSGAFSPDSGLDGLMTLWPRLSDDVKSRILAEMSDPPRKP
jgi:hypothetical protein